MPRQPRQVPTCGHPDKRVKGHGKCEKCYDLEYYQQPGKAEAARRRTKEWRERHPERAKRLDYTKHVVRKYGITLEEYEHRFAQQNGRCALCGDEQPDKRLAVDHCHNTGKIRALLCLACNSGLGQFKDNPDLLERAADYIRAYAES